MACVWCVYVLYVWGCGVCGCVWYVYRVCVCVCVCIVSMHVSITQYVWRYPNACVWMRWPEVAAGGTFSIILPSSLRQAFFLNLGLVFS